MPEGDTLARAAAGLRRRVAGKVVTAAQPAPLARLAGRRLETVHAVGKHLYMDFGDGLVLHTHMRMTGSWHVHGAGERWRIPQHRATATIRFGDTVAVLFAAPVCELIPSSRVGEGLGPDVLAPSLDTGELLRRARAAGRATVAELLLDQRVCAGIGNIYRCEALWHESLDPLLPPADLDDQTLLRPFLCARDLMRRAMVPDAFRVRPAVHGRAGRPCPRCSGTVVVRPLGSPSRLVYWCPGCQSPKAPLRQPAPSA